jgi:hypothetical protein
LHVNTSLQTGDEEAARHEIGSFRGNKAMLRDYLARVWRAQGRADNGCSIGGSRP